VAQLVQGDVAQGHVLLQLRGAGDPVAQALGEDQGVVAQAQRVLGHVLGGPGQAGADLERDVLRAERVARRDAGGAGRPVAAGTCARDADGDVAVACGLLCLLVAHRCFTPSLLV
jgi:hypothetical protein